MAPRVPVTLVSVTMHHMFSRLVPFDMKDHFHTPCLKTLPALVHRQEVSGRLQLLYQRATLKTVPTSI